MALVITLIIHFRIYNIALQHPYKIGDLLG